MKKIEGTDYLQGLRERGSQRNITQEFQLTGLEIATLLRDLSHKALYIKYAKEFGNDRMRALAKDVSERRDVKNPAAYFMALVKELRASRPKKETA